MPPRTVGHKFADARYTDRFIQIVFLEFAALAPTVAPHTQTRTHVLNLTIDQPVQTPKPYTAMHLTSLSAAFDLIKPPASPHQGPLPG